MNFSTNGWDYIYNVNLSQLNKVKNEPDPSKETFNVFENNLKTKIKDKKESEAFNDYIKEQLKNIKYDGIDDVFCNNLILDTKGDTKPVIDYFLDLIDQIVDKLHENNKFLTSYLKLKSNITKEDKDVEKKLIAKKYKDVEKKMITQRAKVYLECSDEVGCLYKFEKSIVKNELEKKTIADLLKTPEKIKPILTTLLSALYPVTQVNETAVFFNKKSNKDKHNFRLNINGLSNWKFITGDDERYTYIDYDLGLDLKDLNTTGKDSNIETTTHNVKLTIKLNLAWLVGKDSDKPGYEVTSNSIEIIEMGDLKVQFPNENQYIKSCLEQYFNNKSVITKPYIEAGIYCFTTNYHEYYHAFLNFNMPALLALDKDKKHWMSPSQITFGIKNAYGNNIDTSVLSICCMIDNNTNNKAPYTDINAIPNDAHSALVIDRDVFAQKMLLPSLVEKILKSESESKNFVKEHPYSYTYEQGGEFLSSNFNGYDSGTFGKKSFKVIVEEEKIKIQFSKVEYCPSFISGNYNIDQTYLCEFNDPNDEVEESFSEPLNTSWNWKYEGGSIIINTIADGIIKLGENYLVENKENKKKDEIKSNKSNIDNFDIKDQIFNFYEIVSNRNFVNIKNIIDLIHFNNNIAEYEVGDTFKNELNKISNQKSKLTKLSVERVRGHNNISIKITFKKTGETRQNGKTASYSFISNTLKLNNNETDLNSLVGDYGLDRAQLELQGEEGLSSLLNLNLVRLIINNIPSLKEEYKKELINLTTYNNIKEIKQVLEKNEKVHENRELFYKYVGIPFYNNLKGYGIGIMNKGLLIYDKYDDSEFLTHNNSKIKNNLEDALKTLKSLNSSTEYNIQNLSLNNSFIISYKKKTNE